MQPIDMQQDAVMIPKSRIAILIGAKGKDKNLIQKEGDVKLNINSKTGNVTVLADDALKVWNAINVVKAVARGFPPEIARKLFKQDYVYEQVSLEDFAKNKKQLIRQRGRVIGRGGSARDHLQLATQTQIRVQGKTIMIIGEMECVETARQAVEAILAGTPHAKVYELIQERVK